MTAPTLPFGERVVARLPMDRPLRELAELLAAITRCERGQHHEVDVHLHDGELDVVDVVEVDS